MTRDTNFREANSLGSNFGRLLLRPVFESENQEELRTPWQMRNVNLTSRAIAIEPREIVLMGRDDRCMRANVISVIDGFVSSTGALIASGWSEPSSGGTFTRSRPPPFLGARYRELRQLTRLTTPRATPAAHQTETRHAPTPDATDVFSSELPFRFRAPLTGRPPLAECPAVFSTAAAWITPS